MGRARVLGTLMPVVLLISVASAVACGDDDDNPLPTGSADTDQAVESDLTGAELAFLDEVQRIDAEMDAQFKELLAILNGSWPVESVFYSAFSEVRVSETLALGFEQLQGLTPPDRFAEDHGVFLAELEGALAQSRALDRAVDEQSFVDLTVAASELQISRGRLVNGVSLAFCQNALVLDPAVSGGVSCPSHDGLPGGEYGAAVYDIMRDYAAEFGPRAGAFPIALSDEDFSRALLAQQPHIIAVLEDSRRALAALDAPSEFDEDHARLLAYFDDTTALSREITEAAENREANRLRDQLFPESGVIACNAYPLLTEPFRRLVEPFFGASGPAFC